MSDVMIVSLVHWQYLNAMVPVANCQGKALSFLFWASYFGYTMHNNILMMLDLVAVTEY